MKKILALSAIVLSFALTSCLQDKAYEGPSNIETLLINPEAPTSNDQVTVTVTTSGLQALSSAEISYNGQKTAMTVSGKTATGVIPSFPDKTNVKFTVTVKNTAGYSSSKDGEYTVGNPPTDYTKLVLNELCGAGEDNEKFIELYNNSDFDISLKDITLHKDEELCWTGLEGEVCPAKGIFLILGAKKTTERGITSGFSAKKSVLIELFNPSGVCIGTFQRGDKGDGWGNQGLDNNKGSWARIPDGTGKLMIVSNPTPGEKNDETGAVEDPDLK